MSGFATVALDIGAIGQLLGLNPSPVYGVFASGGGGQVLTGYHSVVGFGFQRDYRNITYPVEKGGFQTYNKIALPFGAKLQYAVNGGVPTISAFIAQLEKLCADTNTYEVVTPEYTWQNVNIHHYDVRRESRHGVSLLIFDVWCDEIRQAAAPQLSSTGTGTSASPTATATPDGQTQQGQGIVQPQPATAGTPSAGAASYSGTTGETLTPPPGGVGAG